MTDLVAMNTWHQTFKNGFEFISYFLAFVSWSMAKPNLAKNEFGAWQSWIGKSFTWLYIGSQVKVYFETSYKKYFTQTNRQCLQKHI